MVISLESNDIISQGFFGKLSYLGEIVGGVDAVGVDHEFIQECPSHVPETLNCTSRNVAKLIEG